MGLFDFLKRDRGAPPPEKEVLLDKKLASLVKMAADKRAQSYDRDEAIRKLIAIGTHETASALMKRFALQVDPSITDQEEKQLAFDGIVSIGRGERGKRVSDAGKDPKEISDEPLTNDELAELKGAVVDRARKLCESAENLTWLLKVMRALLDDTSYQKQLLDLLSRFDTEYTRNVEPKINLIAALEEVASERVRTAVERYLDDVNETVRFHAVETVYAQKNPESIGELVAMAKREESVRVKNKVAEGMIRLGWRIPEPLREEFRAALQDAYEFAMSADGEVKKVS